MTTVIFDVPPPRSTKDEDIKNVARQLRAHPGQWGIIRRYAKTKQGQRAAHNYANHINKGRLAALRGFESYAHTGDAEVHVWARCP